MKESAKASIKLVSTHHEPLLNGGEIFRRIIVYDVDGKEADMIAVMEADGSIRAYNMDMDCYYDKVNQCFGEQIDKCILNKLIEMAELQCSHDYKGFA